MAAVLLASFFATTALPAGAAGTCPLAGGVRRYYFLPVQSSGNHYPTTTAHRIGNSRYGFKTDQNISNNPLPAGTYSVRLATYDPHHAGGGTGGPEPYEQWHAEFLGNGNNTRTARTPDLSDKIVAASWPMGNQTFGSPVTLLRGVHDPADPKARHGFVVWYVEFSC